jgi:hypothetical protein
MRRVSVLMEKVNTLLYFADGTFERSIEVSGGFYVPPQILVVGKEYYIRTSSEVQHEPLEFKRALGWQIVTDDGCDLPTTSVS